MAIERSAGTVGVDVAGLEPAARVRDLRDAFEREPGSVALQQHGAGTVSD
jgi:hypothetical protein